MLRSVCFKNFVNFKEKQFLDFNDAGPFIFIGENGAGKSSVLEGIRRCLKTGLSTSVSSSFDEDKLSYLICNYEVDASKKEYVISGVAAISDKLTQENSVCANVPVPENVAITGKAKKDATRKNDKAYYKFTLYRSEKTLTGPMQKRLLCVNPPDGHLYLHQVKSLNETENDDLKQKFVEAIFDGNTQESDDPVESFLLSELNPKNLETYIEKDETECGPLDLLTDKVVFTFPLRSIGPLQWSESERITPGKREENYTEAERRCEIIKCFLADKDQTRFDRARENRIFKAITKSESYNFELEVHDNRLFLNGEKYPLLKTPEGILEAKAFSILMSGRDYKTIILEEPDRGMHPQFIERMIHMIKQYQSEKRVILTTHNTAFISPWSLSNCFVFRRNNKECGVVSGKDIARGTNKINQDRIFMKQLRLLTNDHISDILFAKRVLFCEGDSDFLFLTELKHNILSGEAKEIDIFKGDTFDFSKLEDSLVALTIIKLNSKGNTELCQTVSKIIKLDAIFLLDRDAPERNEKFKNKFNIFFWKYRDLEDMVIDMCKADDSFQKKIEEQNVTINKAKFQMKKSRNEKLFLRDDVSVENIKAGVRLILEQCKPENDLASLIKFLYEGKSYVTA